MSNQVKETVNLQKVITGVVRLSYANLWQPKSINGGKEKYSVSLIIPKSDKATLAKIKAATEAAYSEGLNKLKAFATPESKAKWVAKHQKGGAKNEDAE